MKNILVAVFKNCRKFSSKFSDFRISENFREIDITVHILQASQAEDMRPWFEIAGEVIDSIIDCYLKELMYDWTIDPLTDWLIYMFLKSFSDFRLAFEAIRPSFIYIIPTDCSLWGHLRGLGAN